MIHQQERRQLEQALNEGKISLEEYTYYIEHHAKGERKTTPKRTEKTTLTIAAIPLTILLIIGLFAGAFYFNAGDGITGLVTYKPTTNTLNQIITENTIITLNGTNTTTIKITGELYSGSVNIHTKINGEKKTILSGTIDKTLWTEYESYANAENITIEVEAENYSLWVKNDETQEPIDNNVQLIPGEYTIIALINDQEQAGKKTLQVTVREDNETENNTLRTNTNSYLAKCEQTCAIPETNNLELIINVSNGTEFLLQEIILSEPKENNKPEQTTAIPELTLLEETTIDLNEFFYDADGDSIVYDITQVTNVDSSIEDNMLTLTPMSAGTSQATIYASDLEELIISNAFTITVPQITIEENTTAEDNTTSEITNTTEQTNNSNTTTNSSETTQPIQQETNNEQTNTGVPQIVDCTNPNINLRPTECFGENLDLAYKDVVANLEDKNQQKVGRFTRFGNLVIRGRLVSQSSAQPNNADFQVGYNVREDFLTRQEPTAWIDSATGDLHLKGQLYQEQTTITPPQYNSYIIQNSNGIVLGYIDEQTGNLYLKGNLVQLGNI